MVLETLYRGLGFTRVLLFIRDARRREMTARFGLGERIDELLPRSRFGLEREQDLFARAVQGQEDLIYTAGGRNAAELPDWYRRQVSPHTLALYPMVVNRVCLGLIYADREDAGRPLTGSERNYLNTLRNQATLAIKHRS
jgi:GAF domain-containing protein